MDADTKTKIESWLSTKLMMAGIGVGDPQSVVTWQFRDTDLFELQQKIGNHFCFSVSGIITEQAILAAYEEDQKNS